MLHVTDIAGLQAGGASRASLAPAPSERCNAAIRSASQPVETPLETDVYHDPDKSLPLLTNWIGRPAVSPAHLAYAFTLRTPIRPPDQRVNPPSQVLDEHLVRRVEPTAISQVGAPPILMPCRSRK